ncbi:MAG: cation:proton antiporter [Candidatus Abyssubacteria bacterium]
MNMYHVAFMFALSILGLAFVLAFVRLLIGPSLPDRVIALDLLGIIGIGFISVYSVEADESVFLNVAAVMALIAFLTTVAFAYHVRRGG